MSVRQSQLCFDVVVTPDHSIAPSARALTVISRSTGWWFGAGKRPYWLLYIKSTLFNDISLNISLVRLFGVPAAFLATQV